MDEDKWRRAVFTRSTTEIETSLLLPSGELESLGTYSSETEARNKVVAHLRSLNPKTLVRFDTLVGDLSSLADDLAEGEPAPSKTKRAVAYFQLAAGDSLGSDEDARSLAAKPVTLAEHTRVIEAVARKLGVQLGLSLDLCEAIAIAARWHDRGKDRHWWQAAIGNPSGEPLAKSEQSFFDHSLNKGYRHEFGSLIDAGGS